MYSKADESVERIAKRVLKKEYPHLQSLRIIYVFREKVKSSDDGQAIAAQVKILSPKMRDIYGWDIEVEIARPIWHRIGRHGRYQLLWHEFRHLHVDWDERKNEPDRDKEGRIRVTAKDHDLVLKTFKAEIRKFGLTKHEVGMLKFLAGVYRDYKKGKIEQRPVHRYEDEVIEFDA